MLYPPCPQCGELVYRTTAGRIALELARGGNPLPYPLRHFIEVNGGHAECFACGCGWSGWILGVVGESSPRRSA